MKKAKWKDIQLISDDVKTGKDVVIKFTNIVYLLHLGNSISKIYNED